MIGMDGSIDKKDFVDCQEDSMKDQREELRVLEAILFAVSEPMTEEALAKRLPEGADIPSLIQELSSQYKGRGIVLQAVGGRWAFRTAPDLSGVLQMEIKISRKLSRAAVEVLAIIGYHQPITRGEIEEIRGVALSKGTLDLLLEIGWIRPVGKRKTPGRPVTWGTTQEFLNHFNLNKVSDLPGADELKAAGLLDTRPTRSIFGEVAVNKDNQGFPDVTDENNDEGPETLNFEERQV